MVLVARLSLVIILLGLYRGTPLQYAFILLFYVLAFRDILFLFTKPFLLVIFAYFITVQFLNAPSSKDAFLSLSLPLSVPLGISLARRCSKDLFESLLIKLCSFYTVVYIALWSIAGNFNFQIFNFITGTTVPSKLGALDVIPIVAYLIYLLSRRHWSFTIILLYFILVIKLERGMLITLPIFLFFERKNVFRKYKNLVSKTTLFILTIGLPFLYKYLVIAYQYLILFFNGNKSFDSSINSRIDQLLYVFQDYSLFTFLMGHGIPRESVKDETLEIDYFYWQDLGIFGVHWAFGIIGLILIFLLVRVVLLERDRLKSMSRYIIVLLVINSILTAKILFSFGILISAYIYLKYDNNYRSFREEQRS